MHNRSQFIENIKSYMSSEAEYSLTALIKKESDYKEDLLKRVSTDTPYQELYETYSHAVRSQEFIKTNPKTIDKIIEFLVKEDAKEADEPFTHFEKQLDHLRGSCQIKMPF